jgi:hypothetical protein
VPAARYREFPRLGNRIAVRVRGALERWVNAFNLKTRAVDDYRHLAQFALSHFAHGILTFQLNYLFRTEPGWNMFATGPTNNPKDGIAPLSGVIEIDWLPYPFDPSTLKEAWQRFYYLGKMPDGSEALETHTNKMNLAAPVDNRGTPVAK